MRRRYKQRDQSGETSNVIKRGEVEKKRKERLIDNNNNKNENSSEIL